MAGQSTPVQVPGNAVQDIQTYFQPGSVGVTNPGSCWVHFSQSAGSDAWIPPRQYGVVIRPPVNYPATIRVTTNETPSIIYPLDLSDLAPAQLTIFEDVLALSPGQSLLNLIPSAAFPIGGVSARGVIQAIANFTLDQAGAGTIVLNAPAGIQDGDVLVALIGQTGNAAVTSPAGWTRQLFQASATNGAALIIDTHTAILGDPANWTWTGTTLTDGIIAAYRGAEGVVSLEPLVSSSSGQVIPSTITSIPNDWLLAVAARPVSSSGAALFNSPTSLTQRATANNGAGRSVYLFDTNGPVTPGTHGPYAANLITPGSGPDRQVITAAMGLIPSLMPVNLFEINGRLLDAATKGVQTSIALPTQDFIDAGRAQVMLSWEEMAGTAAAESALTNYTLASLNAAALGAANNYPVSAGKRLRIQSVTIYLKSTGAAAILARFRIRQAGAVANNSAVIFDAVMNLPSATFAAGEGDELAIPIPDGLEVAAGQQITFTWFTSANTCTVGMSITGFEY